MKFRLFDVDVKLHWSTLLLVILVSSNLTNAVMKLVGNNAVQAFVCSLICAVLLIASVIAHEFAHIIIGRKFGIEFSSITIFVLGGAAKMDSAIKNAKSEFWMALAGPLSSLALAGLFLGIALVLKPFNLYLGLIVILAYVCFANFVLAVSNLLIAFPLDGGRVLRSIIWRITKDYQKSTNIASVISFVLAWSMISWTVLSAIMLIGFGIPLPFFGLHLSNEIWFSVLAMFIIMAAKAEMVAAKNTSIIRY